MESLSSNRLCKKVGVDVEGEDEDEERKPDHTPLMVQMTFRQGARKSDSRIMTTETTQATERSEGEKI